MDCGLLAQEQPQEGFEKSLSAFFGVVHELEEAEVERKALLRDASPRHPLRRSFRLIPELENTADTDG
jgi:hypothetical protein